METKHELHNSYTIRQRLVSQTDLSYRAYFLIDNKNYMLTTFKNLQGRVFFDDRGKLMENS
jgi:hypothetical protein